jgi:hypothetical protein
MGYTENSPVGESAQADSLPTAEWQRSTQVDSPADEKQTRPLTKLKDPEERVEV